MKIAPILAKMELAGIGFDNEALLSVEKTLQVCLNNNLQH
jgi:DNA polymerase I-like protein with 3'-5' exonuclease and polymerase domains